MDESVHSLEGMERRWRQGMEENTKLREQITALYRDLQEARAKISTLEQERNNVERSLTMVQQQLEAFTPVIESFERAARLQAKQKLLDMIRNMD